MLRISKLADYGTVIMNYLALHSEQVFSAAEIARNIHMQTPTVSKLLKLLLEADLVISIRGAEGGYRLARSAEQITIAQIIAAIEGLPALTECCDSVKLCAQDSFCAIKGNWKVVNRFILAALENLTLSDMTKPLALSPLLDRIKPKSKLTGTLQVVE